jgi:hypothetical protein
MQASFSGHCVPNLQRGKAVCSAVLWPAVGQLIPTTMQATPGWQLIMVSGNAKLDLYKHVVS